MHISLFITSIYSRQTTHEATKSNSLRDKVSGWKLSFAPWVTSTEPVRFMETFSVSSLSLYNTEALLQAAQGVSHIFSACTVCAHIDFCPQLSWKSPEPQRSPKKNPHFFDMTNCSAKMPSNLVDRLVFTLWLWELSVTVCKLVRVVLCVTVDQVTCCSLYTAKTEI